MQNFFARPAEIFESVQTSGEETIIYNLGSEHNSIQIEKNFEFMTKTATGITIQFSIGKEGTT